MQQIERYGVIALVFLLVTIVAVSFWGDSKSPGFWSRLTGRGDAKKMEIAKNPATADRALDNALPLTNNPSVPPVDAAQPQGAIAIAPAEPQSAETAMANANAPDGSLQLPNGAQAPIRMPPAQDPAPFVAANAPSATPAAVPAMSAAAPAKKAAAASGPTIEYVVQKGDSLASIAQRSLGSSSRWTEIQSLNGGIQPKALRVGTKLKLPAGATKTALEKKSAPKAESSAPKKSAAPTMAERQAGGEYVVRSGDTLRTIAEKKLGSADRWKEIVAVNKSLDPKKLVVGKSIKLPASEARAGHSERALVAAAAPSSARAAGKPHVR